jgi:hypothetical protein
MENGTVAAAAPIAGASPPADVQTEYQQYLAEVRSQAEAASNMSLEDFAAAKAKQDAVGPMIMFPAGGFLQLAAAGSVLMDIFAQVENDKPLTFEALCDALDGAGLLGVVDPDAEVAEVDISGSLEAAVDLADAIIEEVISDADAEGVISAGD